MRESLTYLERHPQRNGEQTYRGRGGRENENVKDRKSEIERRESVFDRCVTTISVLLIHGSWSCLDTEPTLIEEVLWLCLTLYTEKNKTNPRCVFL